MTRSGRTGTHRLSAQPGAVLAAGARIAAGPNRARRLVRWVCDVVADRVLGIDSAREVSHTELGFDAAAGHHYQAASWLKLIQLARVLDDLAVSARDVFVDFGSGKGRVLCLAARYPFGRVIGVELSEGLSRIARGNIARNSDRFACNHVQVEVGDATAYPLPDDVTVAYLNDPFPADIFRRVMDNVCTSVARAPRVVVLIYHHPTMHDYLVARGFRTVRQGRHLAAYVVPGGGRAPAPPAVADP